MRTPSLLVLALLAAPNALAAQDASGFDGMRQVSIGVGIQCSYCRMAFPEYEFGVPPMINKVTKGSAGEKAGLAVGDTLLAIEGESITTAAGAGYFAARVPGRSQRWTVKREGKEVTVTVAIPKDA